MHSNAYTFRFAIMVTLVCSVLLAGAATLLKPRQVENELLDKRKNVLASVGIKPEEGKTFGRKEINRLYEEKIREYVLDENGERVDGKKPADIDPRADKNLLAYYEQVEEGQTLGIIIPVSGKGLWSTIYGYLALENDCNTVKGITFYKHGETPGLGGEIEKEWFTSNFVGKKIRNEQGDLVSITVVKGKVSDQNKVDPSHAVVGVSGSTLTCRGVTNFLKEKLKAYEPFFDKKRAEGGV